MTSGASVERLDVSVHRIPTDSPESDGTIEWDSTTIVVVEAGGGGATGLGYTYASAAAAEVVTEQLRDLVARLRPARASARPATRWAQRCATSVDPESRCAPCRPSTPRSGT